MLGHALADLTVVDFSQGIAGPYCACMLGEFGARVIKVEPSEGDWGRYIGPQYGDSGVIFRLFNKGKQSVVLDLKDARARDAALRLVDRADVFVESNRPGITKRYGLDHTALRERNPRLVYVSVTGFGQDGPYATRAATDSLMQAYTGLSLAAVSSPEPARLKLGIIDVSAGIYASNAVLAALMARERSGTGQYLDINLTHTAAAIQAYKIAEDAASGGAPQQELYAGTGTYRTQDSWLAVSAIRDKHVEQLLCIVERGDLLRDPRFESGEQRLANQEALRGLIAVEVAKRPTAHWLARMREADLMGQEVLSYSRFRDDAHVKARNIFQEIGSTPVGPLPVVRVPGLDVDEAELGAYPDKGCDTRVVLAELGLSSEDIDAIECAAGAASRKPS